MNWIVLVSAPENGTEFHSQHHVALHFEFAGHECHLTIEFTIDNGKKIRRIHSNAAVCLTIAGIDAATAFSEVYNPGSRVVTYSAYPVIWSSSHPEFRLYR